MTFDGHKAGPRFDNENFKKNYYLIRRKVDSKLTNDSTKRRLLR